MIGSNEHEENGSSQGSEVLDMVPVNRLGAMIRAEIDTQIATAKSYPRSVAAFKKSALAMATLDEETAASCFYSLPRGGKPITGPSIRLAEIIGSAWGNIRYGSRVVADDGRIITAQGICTDLEKNISATVEVGRRVTGKNGRRFSDDMIVVTGNAACSIALRNAIFKVVPMSFVKDVLDKAREVAIGNAHTLEARRASVVAYFGKMGLTPERVFAAVGKASIEDVGLDELAVLSGLKTAIHDGDTTVDEAFPPVQAPGTPVQKPNGTSKAEQLGEKLGEQLGSAKKPPAKKPAKPAAAPPPVEPEQPAEIVTEDGEVIQAGMEPQQEPTEATAEQAQADMAAKDLFDSLWERIQQADSTRGLSEVGADMNKQKDALGDLFAKLHEDYNAKYRQLVPAKAKK